MHDFKALAAKYKDEAINTLSDLIACKSVLDEYNPNSDAPFGKGNKEALDYILNKARSEGLVAKNCENYAGHIEYGSQNGELLGILAHLDVVPVTLSEWHTDPFKLTIIDNKMYGRGTADDKGALVASFYALKLLKDEQINLSKKVRLIMGCDEESGSRCLSHYFTKEEMPKFGFSPDASFPVIHGEKAASHYYVYLRDNGIIKDFISGDRFNIVPALAKMELNINLKDEYLEYLQKNNYKGEISGDTYIAHGVASHAAFPQNGLNAAFILLDFLAQYSESKAAKLFSEYFSFNEDGHKLGINVKDGDMGALTMNCGLFSFHNGVLVCGLDFRIPKDNYTEVIDKKFTSLFDGDSFSFKKLSASKIHYVRKDSFLVKKLMEAYSSITGDTVNKPFTIGGGTYAKFIDECVAFGPEKVGAPDVCHISNEYMNVDDFVELIAIYAKAIYELGR